jgi:hypothetical protein
LEVLLPAVIAVHGACGSILPASQSIAPYLSDSYPHSPRPFITTAHALEDLCRRLCYSVFLFVFLIPFDFISPLAIWLVTPSARPNRLPSLSSRPASGPSRTSQRAVTKRKAESTTAQHSTARQKPDSDAPTRPGHHLGPRDTRSSASLGPWCSVVSNLAIGCICVCAVRAVRPSPARSRPEDRTLGGGGDCGSLQLLCRVRVPGSALDLNLALL